MSDINHGTYVALHLTHKSVQRLHAWGKEQGIENLFEPEDFHITVCYSKRPLQYTPLERLPPLPVKPVGFDKFGKEKDYLVMKVQSKLAKARHDTARALGAAHDFPDYKPHISLAKGGKMPTLKELKPFPDLLFVNRETASVLDPSFKPGAEGYVDGPLIKKLLTADEMPRRKTDAEIQTIYKRVSDPSGLLYHVAHARCISTASDGQWTVQWLDGKTRKTKKFDDEQAARVWYERIRHSSILRDVKIHAPWSF